jgi:hypothetical protein
VLGVERPFPRPPSPEELDGSQTNREARVESGTPWREHCGLPLPQIIRNFFILAASHTDSCRYHWNSLVCSLRPVVCSNIHLIKEHYQQGTLRTNTHIHVLVHRSSLGTSSNATIKIPQGH